VPTYRPDLGPTRSHRTNRPHSAVHASDSADPLTRPPTGAPAKWNKTS
jgi:hypothetical protein